MEQCRAYKFLDMYVLDIFQMIHKSALNMINSKYMLNLGKYFSKWFQ